MPNCQLAQERIESVNTFGPTSFLSQPLSNVNKMSWLSKSLVLALLTAGSVHGAETRSSDSRRPRGVGPECNFSPFHLDCIPYLFRLYPCSIGIPIAKRCSCQVLQVLNTLCLHIQSFVPNCHFTSQRRLLRLPRWLRRARNVRLLPPLTAVALHTVRGPVA